MKRHTPLLSALLFCAASMNAANLVANGGFEQGTLGIGSFQAWTTNLGDTSTFVDSSGTTGPLYGEAFAGLWAAYFGSTAADGGASISQTLATTAGQQYLLTFELANDNAGLAPVNAFTATIGGSPALALTNQPDQPYEAYQLAFTASSSATALTFFGSNDNSYFELDDVAVNAAPEPASLALLLAASALLLALHRRVQRAALLLPRARVHSRFFNQP